MNKKLNAAIVFGGKSGEHEVSLMSATNVIKAMDKEKYNIYMIGITRQGKWMVYDGDAQRVGYATSFMYSPVLQRHIALARVRPDLAKVGTRVQLEFTVDHHYEKVAAHVARLPLYNPERKTA